MYVIIYIKVRIWLPEISKYLHCEQERSNPEDKCCLALVMCAINLPVKAGIKCCRFYILVLVLYPAVMAGNDCT